MIVGHVVSHPLLGSTGECGGENRRVFYDFTFSPPKSVSIAALVGDDPRIVAAHRVAAKAAVRELEAFAGTRVRTAGGNSDRTTGNIVAALSEHETSRALDPHLHTHCIVFNATHDAVENRWKALPHFQRHELLPVEGIPSRRFRRDGIQTAGAQNQR